MDTEINNFNSKFGIEVEFYIVDQNGYPVVNSNKIIQSECLAVDSNLNIVLELSSFQIEINPGPWKLDSNGLKSCLEELKYHYNILKRKVENHGWKLCKSLMPANLSQDIIYHPDFFTKNSRFKASSDYFEKRDDIRIQNELSEISFPGERIIGCINEIHIHAQLSKDSETLKLYNYLNLHGIELTKSFNQLIKINDQNFKDIDSLKLFELANGEWNSDKTISRVGNIPNEITSREQYISIIESFNKIPFDSQTYLDLESTVYFWTRLRGEKGDLRVEFRPMEMGENWIERVEYLYEIIKDFENFYPDCQAHLQFTQPNAKT